MSINSVYSGHPFPTFSQSPHFFIAGLHRNWHPSSARGLSAVTSNGLDVVDYAMGYKLVRRALAFFQHLCSRPGFRLPSLHFFLGPSFSDESFSPLSLNGPHQPSLIFGKYLSGLFSNFRRLRKLTRFLNLLFPPRAVFLIDTKRANSAPNELSRLSLPLGALCGSAVDPLFIPYPVLSNYSVQSMSFFFRLFFSVSTSGALSSNLSYLLKFVSPGRRRFKIRSSPKVFGPSVKAAVRPYFLRFLQQFKLFFSQRFRKSFFGRRRYRGGDIRIPSRVSLRSKNRIPRTAPHWHHFKRITLTEFRIFIRVRLSYFLKHPLLFWFYAENIFRDYNPHISYNNLAEFRFFIHPNRLKVLYNLYERLRPLFFLITIMTYALQLTQPLSPFCRHSPFFKGFSYSSLYTMLLDPSSSLSIPSFLSRPARRVVSPPLTLPHRDLSENNVIIFSSSEEFSKTFPSPRKVTYLYYQYYIKFLFVIPCLLLLLSLLFISIKL